MLRKGFDLLRNSPLSSIYIHFEAQLLDFGSLYYKIYPAGVPAGLEEKKKG